MSYQDLLNRKVVRPDYSGFNVDKDSINPMLFKYQVDAVRWSLKLGTAALFLECGLGKTPIQLEWAKHVIKNTGQSVLILAPLAVASQTVREGTKFTVPCTYIKQEDEMSEGAHIYITNYERLHNFTQSLANFAGVVLDESSILKSYTGTTKEQIISAFAHTPYKLACTATPAPNDHMELGNHSEFLGIMPSNEMLSRWFINDTMRTGGYRVKKHAEKDFWRWVTSWALCLSHPRDLGEDYDMPQFNLPELHFIEHYLNASAATIERAKQNGRLIADANVSATNIHKVKRESLDDRVQAAREITDNLPSDSPILIWCDTNYESDALLKSFSDLDDVYEVRGSHTASQKEERLTAFSDSKCRILITKPSIAGFGLNWQHCNNMIFVGVTFKFEPLYQALRRSWRFGQTKEVNAYVIYTEGEGNVMARLQEKQVAFEVMQSNMNDAMKEYGLFREEGRLKLSKSINNTYVDEKYTMHLGDCVERIRDVPDNSVHLSVFSPPFSNLYIYSDNEADMGNSVDDYEFFEHFAYLVPELFRITQPGRLVAIHCKNLPAYIGRDGYAGLRDFKGEIIRMMEMFNLNPVQPPDISDMTKQQAYNAIVQWQKQVEERKSDTEGFRFQSEFMIWKDPVVEMQRTKNMGLLHKSIRTQAEVVRQGMPDYMIVFRKWSHDMDDFDSVEQRWEVGDYIGTNPPQEHEYINRKRGENEAYSIAKWQRYASAVWDDIDQTNVLNYRIAKGNQDEKHICPLQLDVIARCIDLWTAEGEMVFSPFAGIGSEGYEALRLNRKFVGIELKEEYYNKALGFLAEAERQSRQKTLFDLLPDQENNQ